MRLVTFTIEKLKSMPRPAGYLDDLRPCAVEITASAMTFDADSDCYRALKAKYAPSKAASTPEDEWAKRGPKMWAELHRRPQMVEREIEWIQQFGTRIPCGSCRQHWKNMVQRTPADLSSPAAYFAWTVDRHNEVNARLGKPIISMEEARSIWA